MKFSTVFALLFSATALAVPTAPKSPAVSYDGAKVVRIQLDDTPAQTKKLQALISKLDLELWSHAVLPNHLIDIQVSKEKLGSFEAGLDGLTYTTMHEDLGAAIRAESATDGLRATDGAWCFAGSWGCGC